MSIRYEHIERVAVSPAQAFAAIDNLPLTAQWLPPCVSLAKVGSGPNRKGDKLHYVFRQGGRQSEMSGEIMERVEGQRLFNVYRDASFEVAVDLRVAPAEGGSQMTHIIEIVPKTFFGRLMSPLIRLGLKKQTQEAAGGLKRLLEKGN